MDQSTPAQTNYDGGIIFLSYVIAVIGAMTTLELLQRRTHIRGSYNWFLLFAAAASMGGVGIWSMHFIGNNSLTITIENGDKHQLSYATGFTFASLIVAIFTMFFAFAFVGITEEAKVGRIIPSGIIAGFGIVSMHYLGQVAVDFFIMKNKLALVVAATVIAVCAVTVALFIFFKLREQWANQWYKRLGCAMLMGVAVCGMHYTALVGTVYYPGDLKSGPPVPLLGTPALIGIIAAIVIFACVILFFIGAKNQIENNSILFQTKKSHKRLILDTIFFDTNGRILVKVDGIVPMKEILNEIPEDESYESFSTSHPLFTRLFETTIQWAKSRNSSDEEVFGNSCHLSPSSSNLYSMVDDAFLTAANELVEELRFTKLSDLGHLFDSVLNTNTISKKSMFSQESKRKKKLTIRRSSSIAGSFLLSPTRFSYKESTTTLDEVVDLPHLKSSKKNKTPSLKRPPSMVSQPEDATVIDIFNNPTTSSSTSRNLTVRDCDSEDRHIFLVKKIESNKDLVNLLSIGFRFAEPVFISKTMGDKLQVPSEYMLNFFKDMLQMTETASAMYTPIKLSNHSCYTSPAQQRQMKNVDVRGGVFVGLFTLIEDNEDNMPYIIVQKQKRYTFPMVQLVLEGETESERKPTELSRLEKNTVLSLSGQSLANIACMDSNIYRNHQRSSSFSKHAELSPGQSIGSVKTLIDIKSSFSPSDNNNDEENKLYDFEPNSSTSLIRHKGVETTRFTKAFETAAKSLIDMSSYGKPLASTARLYCDILDIPAFSLHSGPCQLILFRAHITKPGTRFAINQTLTETIKCVPFPMYRSFAFFITDIAVEKYRAEQNQNKPPSNYLTQQRLYQSTAARNNNVADDMESSTDNPNMKDLQKDGSTALTAYKPALKAEVSALVTPPQQSFSSLPPPPRVKRNKFTLPASISSLEINLFNKDFLLPNMIKGTNVVPLSPNPSSSVEMPIILNLLPASGRFWWLNNMYEETHNT